MAGLRSPTIQPNHQPIMVPRSTLITLISRNPGWDNLMAVSISSSSSNRITNALKNTLRAILKVLNVVNAVLKALRAIHNALKLTVLPVTSGTTTTASNVHL